MSTSLLQGINESIMEDILWALKNGQDINRDREGHSRKRSQSETKYLKYM